MEMVFWLCISGALYVYLGYPLILSLAGRLSEPRQPPDGTHRPVVTLIISAYNEAAVIGAKIQNSLDLEYPADRLDITVVSDCSTDGTDDIVQQFSGRNVTLLRMSVRGGKSLGLNQAVAAARGDIVVFTDANAMFEPHALSHLVRHFSNPEVGAVTGEQRYYEPDGSEPTDEGLYWRYELFLKALESRVGSLVGGDGAILAVRRHLVPELAAADLSDFIIPLRVVDAGYRNVFEPAAACYEHGADSLDKEFARKVRIVNRAWRATLKLRHMLNPWRTGWFAVQLWSHKVLRWFVGLMMAGALASNLWLVADGTFYAVSLLAQLAFYGLALGGLLRARGDERLPTLLSAPYYLCLVNAASLKGIMESFIGKTYATWNTPREANGP